MKRIYGIVSAYSGTETALTYVWNARRPACGCSIAFATSCRAQPWRNASSTTTDRHGLIFGLLDVPEGLPDQEPAVDVHPHGGTWRGILSDMTTMISLYNRGYAVLSPIPRSTSFGKKFLNAGKREWGRKLQD